MTIPTFVIVDQSFSKKTGQIPLDLSNYSLPTTVTTGTYVADILNVRKGLVPTVEPFWNYTVGGSELTGWTLLIGPIPPTVPSTLRITAGGQTARFALFANVISTLGTLTLSGPINNGVTTSGSILGATPGSTIVSNVTGLTVDSINRTYTFNGSASASTVANGLVETLASAIGSPKSNSITVLPAIVTLSALSFASLPNPLYTGSSASGTISGATVGSTITASGLPSGFTIDGAARTWAWSGTGTAVASSVSLIETLAGATNTPRTTSGLPIVISDPVVSLTAPVLSNVSSGWTTGQNPPRWKSVYTNPQGYNPFDGAGDQVRAHWKLGAGSWTTTAWEPLDTELATGVAPAWPFLTDGSLNAGGAFQVWEEIVRDLGLGTEQTSPASNTWTDTLSPQVNTGVIVQEGDSITAAGPSGYAQLFSTAFPANTYHMLAVGGSTLSSLTSRQATARGYDAQVFTVLIGANDLSGYASGAAYYTDLITYLTPFKSDGAKIVVCTVLPQGTPTPGYATNNSNRVALNAALKAAIGGGVIDAVADFDSTLMGLDATANSTTYFDSAGLHPTGVGHAIIYPNYKGAVNAVLGIANSVTQFTFTDATNVTASAVSTSAPIRVSGLNYLETKAVSVTGGEYRKTPFGGSPGSWVTTPGTVVNGDDIEVRGTASGTAGGVVNVVLTIGSVSDTYSITTITSGATWNAGYKSANITLSNGNLTALGTGAVDSGVRASAAATGSSSFTIQTDTIIDSNSVISLAVANSSALTSNRPGRSDSNGISFQFGTWGYEIYYNGTFQGFNYTALALTSGSKAKLTVNPANGNTSFYVAIDGVTFVQKGATVTGVTLAQYYPFVTLNDHSQVTADFTGLV